MAIASGTADRPLLYNLEPSVRAVFAGEMPPIVTEQLVPVVWKEKWGPMQPFLLA